MPKKRKRSPERPPEDEAQDTIFRSAPIEDRSSTFLGLFSPSLKPKDLQKLEEIASASHKILAWRRESNQQFITGGVKYTTDFDDDGEKYGGKKISKVLENMQVVGACVVVRWYGGVLLGPVRFEHIEKCAMEAVKKWQESVVEERSKRRKAEEDAIAKEKLVKVLAERDQSISVLRALAAEKEEQVQKAKEEKQETLINASSQADGEASLPPSAASTEKKATIDYSIMTLERLKAMEKARDATLSFLLKRIDKAEADLTALEGHG
jgi:putative IMPACT (imprinted ancient) family translation regulator